MEVYPVEAWEEFCNTWAEMRNSDHKMSLKAAVVLANQAAELSTETQLAKLTDDWAALMEELSLDEQNAHCKQVTECLGGSTSLTDTCDCHTIIWSTRERQNDPVHFIKNSQITEPIDEIRTKSGKTNKIQHRTVLPRRFTGPIDNVSFAITHTKLTSSRDLDRQSSEAVPSSIDVNDVGTWYAAKDLIGYNGKYVDAQRHLAVDSICQLDRRAAIARHRGEKVLHLQPVVEKVPEVETSEMMDEDAEDDDDMTAEDWINSVDKNHDYEHEGEQSDEMDHENDDENLASNV